MIKVYFDGACTPNPGGIVSYGAAIFDESKLIYEISKLIDIPKEKATNNVAEYIACIAGLNYCLDKKLEHEEILFLGDSQLIINQLAGLWKIKDGAYTEYAVKALFKSKLFKNITFQWIPREENSHANALSQKPLSRKNAIS